MPVIGPRYDKGKANLAFEKVMELLKEDYHIQKFNPIFLENIFIKRRTELNSKLRNIIHELFELDCHEGF